MYGQDCSELSGAAEGVGEREGGRRGFEGPLGEGRGVDPALIVWDFKGCPLRKEAEGVEGWCDRWLRGTGLASA